MLFNKKKPAADTGSDIKRLYADERASGKVKKKVYFFDEDRKNVVDLIAPNGANTRPLSYMTIQDAGRDIYYCALTIDKVPRFPTIGVTFASLFNFKGVTSSVFIHPLQSESVRRVNKRIDMLNSEKAGAEKNDSLNKARELSGKMANAERLARTLDSGVSSLFEVSFLFLLSADSLEELQLKISDFIGIAKGKQIDLSACYGAHAEAFLSALPRNQICGVKINPKLPGRSMLKRHIFDEKSLSTIFNHTSSEFFHKDGVLLGHSLVNNLPIAFDPFDKTHASYGAIFAGRPGYGKSATVKQLQSRLVDFGYYFVGIDYESPNGYRGEYASCAEVCGGVNYTIAADGKDRINFFEINDEIEYDEITGTEFRSLRVKDKVVDMVNILLTIALTSPFNSISSSGFSGDTITRMDKIVTRVVQNLYTAFGIFEGEPDSLYEEDNLGGSFTSGRRKKDLPTMHDFYAELLRLHAKNEDNFKENEYRLLLDSFEDYVKEMYYCPYCLKEFTRQEYEALPVNASGERYHVHDEKHIPVIKVQGTKAYFDGQSTIKLNKNLPMINFDISGVPSTERPIITAVCENFIDEQFIKTNSIDPRKARKLIVYMDEVHEQFPYPGLRQFINRFYRVARKRHVAPWIITQSIVDLYKYPDLEEIVKTTETLFLFKHSDKDKDKIKEAVKLTDSQIEGIIGLSGDEQSEGKRPGECCLVDIPTKQAAFLQVDYLKEAEQYIVETDREVLADLIGGNKGA